MLERSLHLLSSLCHACYDVAPGLLLLLPGFLSPLTRAGKPLPFYNSWTVVVDLGQQVALVTLYTWESFHILLIWDGKILHNQLE